MIAEVANMSLLRSFWFQCESQPPADAGGYKYAAPTELRLRLLQRPLIFGVRVVRNTLSIAFIELKRVCGL